TLTVNASAGVSTSGGTITATAADIALAGTLNSGAGTTTLQTLNGRTMGIGAGAGQYSLSAAELQNITAGNLTIGGAGNGNITGAGICAANAAGSAGTVTLQATGTGRSITFSGTASTFDTLRLTASTGVNVNTDLTTNGTLTVNADSNSDGNGTFAVA